MIAVVLLRTVLYQTIVNTELIMFCSDSICSLATTTTSLWYPDRGIRLALQQQQQPFYDPLSVTTRVSRYQKKHSPTHHPDHHPIFISFFHLPRSIASSLFKLLRFARTHCGSLQLSLDCLAEFWGCSDKAGERKSRRKERKRNETQPSLEKLTLLNTPLHPH